ncbi:MAG: 3'(2'),5'-bisphosphate nucleotidase CysQ [Marinosulfonomonas sp.]|nr:3'(2'),5'-bisphosphate nucleotidase CysQ [Marinosulfonomonas sp.]
MPENDLQLLIDAAVAAGDVASSFWNKSPEVWEKGDDAGPVTEADLAVNELLHDQLAGARPDYGWLSEESEDSAARLDREKVLIIDPIDGTRSFIAGEKTWAHSLAISQNGQVTAAVVYLPLLDKLYTASIGGGASLNGKAIEKSDQKHIDGASLLSAKGSLLPQYWQGDVPSVKRHFRPSLAYRLALVAEGRFDAMMTLRDTWEWDVAAGALIASEAGAYVTDKVGGAPVFNNAVPKLPGILAGTAAVHSGLISRLK